MSEKNLVKEAETQEIAQALPEAGGVAWVELYGTKTDEDGAHVVKINLTSRATTPLDALVSLLGAMSVAHDEYKLKPYQSVKKSAGISGASAKRTSAKRAGFKRTSARCAGAFK